MLLIGVNRSPYTRRVAITLRAYNVAFDQQELTGFHNRQEVRTWNPLGRIPALVLNNSEALIDSAAIIDYLDEEFGGNAPLTPKEGPERRTVLRISAMMMGACDKGLQAAYTRNHTLHQPWIDDCMAQMISALGAIEPTIETDKQYMLFDRLTQADITAGRPGACGGQFARAQERGSRAER
jgi:glutathione S-transferase